MLKSILVFYLILIISILTYCSKTTETDINLRLHINPSDKTIAVDEITQFSLEIKDASHLYGLAVEISFDSTKIELPDNAFVVGNIWDSFQVISFSKNQNDKLAVSIVILDDSDSQGFSGNGTLFYFQLKGKNNGESDVVIENLMLVDQNNDNIEGFDEIKITDSILIVE